MPEKKRLRGVRTEIYAIPFEEVKTKETPKHHSIDLYMFSLPHIPARAVLPDLVRSPCPQRARKEKRQVSILPKCLAPA